MSIIEEHRTPDGLFRFIVERSDDGDILASLSGLSVDAAVRRYIDSLLGGRSFIGIARVAGKIRNVWVTDDPHSDKYKPDDETMEFRYWDG